MTSNINEVSQLFFNCHAKWYEVIYYLPCFRYYLSKAKASTAKTVGAEGTERKGTVATEDDSKVHVNMITTQVKNAVVCTARFIFVSVGMIRFSFCASFAHLLVMVYMFLSLTHSYLHIIWFLYFIFQYILLYIQYILIKKNNIQYIYIYWIL